MDNMNYKKQVEDIKKKMSVSNSIHKGIIRDGTIFLLFSLAINYFLILSSSSIYNKYSIMVWGISLTVVTIFILINFVKITYNKKEFNETLLYIAMKIRLEVEILDRYTGNEFDLVYYLDQIKQYDSQLEIDILITYSNDINGLKRSFEDMNSSYDENDFENTIILIEKFKHFLKLKLTELKSNN